MSVYRAYRKLRNYAGTLHLTSSLFAVHAYSQFMEYGKPIPSSVQVGSIFFDKENLGYKPHPWEFENLIKELIQHGSLYATRSLTRWSDLAGAINLVRGIEGEVAKLPTLKKGIFFELNRLAHRQFVWQQRNDQVTLLRFFKIYSDPSVEPILRNAIGMNASHLYRLGMAMFGHFSDQIQINYPFPADEIDVTQEQLNEFVSRFSRTISELQDEITSSQTFDENFLYCFNPMRAFPIIRVSGSERQVLVVPIPALLLWRFTEGMYYEVSNEAGFDAAYGKSFENYVGEVMQNADTNGRFKVSAATEYYVGRNRKDSIDWILQDDTASVFVECKTKRMRHSSKLSLDFSTDISGDVDKMVDFVVQAYKSLNDAKSGHYPHWKSDDKKLYVLVVTLEEWYASGAPLRAEIEARIRKKLVEIGIVESILESAPYFICSCKEFEYATQIMNTISVEKFMESWKEKRDSMWGLHVFMINQFQSELKTTRNLFKKDFSKIHPALGEGESPVAS